MSVTRFMMLFAVGLMLWPMPIRALSPPPVDPRFGESIKAMDTLAPLLGQWRSGTASRNLWRVGNIILYVISGDQRTLVNVISYDPEQRQFVIHRSTFFSPVTELIPLEMPTPNAIRWAFPQIIRGTRDPRGDVLVAISVVDGEWHEGVIFRNPSDAPGPVPDRIFKRIGPADINVLRETRCGNLDC